MRIRNWKPRVLGGLLFCGLATLGQSQTNKVDLNSASVSELDKLPGVNKATAKKIVAGRPYTSVQDLSRAGVSKKKADRIAPLVTVGPAANPRGSANRTLPAPAPVTGPDKNVAPVGAGASTQAVAPSTAPAAAPAAAPATPGMVWGDTDAKVYHYQGDRQYGKTVHGQYMTEQQALAAGYRAAKP